MGNENLLNKRNRIFSIIEKKLNKNNSSLFMYFNENPKFKVEVKIIDGKPQGFLKEKQVEQFQNIDFIKNKREVRLWII